MSFRKVLVVLTVAAAVTAGGLSLLASRYPDGLEWSVERVAGSTELEADGGIYKTAGQVQDKTAFLPDYAFPDKDSAAGTVVSGLAGCVIVVAVCTAACYAFRFFRRKEQHG